MRWAGWAGLATCLGLAVVMVGVGNARVTGFPVTSSDFLDYCAAVDAVVRRSLEGWPTQRSRVAALLPALFASREGIYLGLFHASVVASLTWMFALFAWARALAGSRAGWLTLAWVGCFAPLVALTRTISFYAEVAAVHALAGACVAGALARGTRAWIVAAAVMMGVLPLIDLRSVVTLVALLPLAVLAGVCTTAPRSPHLTVRLAERASGGALPLLAVAVSWTLGAYAFPRARASLPFAVEAYVRDASSLIGRPWVPPSASSFGVFAWGHGTPMGLVDAVGYLVAVERSRPPLFAEHALYQPLCRELLRLGPVLATAAAVACVGLLRRPRALLAFVLVSAPFLAQLRTAMLTLPHVRQLGLGALVLPLVMGVGCAVLIDMVVAFMARAWPTQAGPAQIDVRLEQAGALVRRRARLRYLRAHVPWLWTALACALLVAALLGRIPGRLGPSASWRAPIRSELDPGLSVECARTGRVLRWEPRCGEYLRRDLARGYTLDVPAVLGVSPIAETER